MDPSPEPPWPPPGSNLPAAPSRDDVLAAMNSVKPAVMACAKGTGGTAVATFTVSGRTGGVTTVQVSKPLGEVGRCIARAVRDAPFPSFQAERFKETFEFDLTP